MKTPSTPTKKQLRKLRKAKSREEIARVLKKIDRKTLAEAGIV